MLKTAVFEQLKQAMRDKDVLSKGVLTLLKAALDKAEKEKGTTLTQEEEVAVVNREVKQTNQALDGAKDAGREEEIAAALTEAGVTKGMNMGDAMKIAKPLLSGKADGATMSKVVKSLI